MPNETMFTDDELREQRSLQAKPPAPINPFASSAPANAASNALAATDQSRAIAETQAAMVIAKRFPRDQVAAMDRILNAFTRPTLAESAMYSYSRGGTDITGPSIRAAETLAQLWGNVQFGVRELEQRPGESTVEAFAWDIETNTRQVKVFQVPHIRHTKKGAYRLEDPRDVYELVANQGARRLRACILGIIPGDVVEAAMNQADVTLNTKAEVTPERLHKLVESFAAYGVTKEAIEKRVQRRIDAITPALLVNLGKIYNSLRDGMSVPADWFELDAGSTGAPAPAAAQAPARGAAGLKAAAAKGAPAPAAAQAPAPEPAASDAAPPPSPERPTLSYAHVRAKLDAAKTRDALDEAAAEIALVVSVKQQGELTELYKAAVAALEE